MPIIKSSKSSAQRKFRYGAPLHLRQHFVRMHVDKALRAKLGIKRSSIRAAKGDTVKVMAGSNKGKSGKIASIDLKSGKVYLDTVSRKNARGKEYKIPISPSNLYLTELDTSYKGRLERLQPAKAEKAEAGEK